MKKILILMNVALLILGGCIEEYDDGYSDSGNNLLVVSGSIMGNSQNTFVLRRSVARSAENYEAINNYVSGAEVTVECSNGSKFTCSERGQGCYVVNIGELLPDEKYGLRIVVSPDEVYTTTPMCPMSSPAIEKASWFMRDDEVNVVLSTEDPHERVYFCWEYEDAWEYVTPYVATYEYSPETDGIVVANPLKNRGWFYGHNYDYVIGTNERYDDGALKKFKICGYSDSNYRFQTKYCIFIRQYALSREEYEYLHLVDVYNSQMGGLFTPMPSELPSNVHGSEGQKAIGFVGVRGSCSEQYVCITSGQVGYKHYEHPRDATEAELEGMSDYNKYINGYRVHEYISFTNEVKWTEGRFVDVTMYGAVLEKPDYWDKLVPTPSLDEEKE